MTKHQRKFVDQLETVSTALAVWAQERIGDGWSIEDLKLALRNAAKLAGRE